VEGLEKEGEDGFAVFGEVGKFLAIPGKGFKAAGGKVARHSQQHQPGKQVTGD
jgi:hypothetical protein